jgi:hypothetical protein
LVRRQHPDMGRLMAELMALLDIGHAEKLDG